MDTRNTQQLVEAMTSHRLSRRTLFKGAGAAGIGLMLAQLPLLRSVAADSESVTDIINIASTAEALAVTLLGGAIDSAMKKQYNMQIPAPVLNILVAARAEEEFHYEYLIKAGAKPLTTSFTVPSPKLLTDYNSLFGTLVQLEAAFIAAYMAAAREFSAMKQPPLVKVAYQIAGVEAEHRVLANYALGKRPANNLAFEQAMFSTVGDAAAALQQLGFIGGSGTKVVYPGPGSIDSSMVTNTMPAGPSVDCTAPSAPPPNNNNNMIPTAPAQPKSGSLYFKETGHNLSEGFRAYWEQFGGLPVYGYPITEEFVENGMTVQYFERARFEWHPGAWPSRYDVELSLLGDWVAKQRDLTGSVPFQPAATKSGAIYFKETGHNLSEGFRAYWEAFGGLAVYGMPISEEFVEGGLTVQYFERQRFEWHPGKWPARFDVELGLLGDEYLAHMMSQ